MLDNIAVTIERIKKQKESLISWEKELKRELSQKPRNSIRKIKFYPAKIDWLNNYVKTFFSGQKDYNYLIYSY